MKELTEEQTFSRATGYCSRAEHCPSEVVSKLRQWGVADEEVQQRIVCRLMQEGYIDESRFCHSFVNDKFRFNHWGKQKIALYLRQKGLPATLIAEALAEIEEEGYEEMTEQLLMSKLKSLKTADPYQLYGKLMRFAAGRGIEQEQAHAAIKRLLNQVPE